MAEKSPEANRGHANRSPGKKIAVIVEWREEGDSQAAVGHGVQETMAGGGQKEITPQSGTRPIDGKRRQNPMNAIGVASSAAKRREWVNPRWPQKSP